MGPVRPQQHGLDGSDIEPNFYNEVSRILTIGGHMVTSKDYTPQGKAVPSVRVAVNYGTLLGKYARSIEKTFTSL